MRKRTAERGSIIFYIVLALIAVSTMSVAVSGISSSSVSSEVEITQLNTARYLAESGLNYAKGLIASYKNQGKTIADTVSAINANSGTVTIPGFGSFQVTAQANGNTIVLSATGYAKSGLARYAIPSSTSVAYTPKTQDASLQGLYSKSNSIMSGTFSGNLTTTGLTLNGGAIISGSLDYLGTGAGCLDLTGGVVLGTAGANSHVCANTCVIVENGATINGTLTSAGNVTVTANVNGDIHSGGDVYLGWGAVVTGDIYATGKVTQVLGYSGYNGKITTGAAKPAACDSYTLPSHESVSSNKKLIVNNTQTFYGVADISDHSNAYSSIITGCGSKICFDLSTPGTYINIFDSGDMLIMGDLYVRTSTSTNCFDDANKVTSITFAGAQAASRVYMDVKGNVTFNGGSSWLGTIYSGGDIIPGGGGVYIGAFYTNGSFNPYYSSGVSTRYIASDYVTKYWP